MREPYKGLRPYEEQDWDNFFGREAEKRILLDKILANKLTLLFAASGVGKSSLLQAAIIPHLKRSEGEGLDVLYHKNWFDRPAFDLKQAMIQYLQQENKITAESSLNVKVPLAEFFSECTIFSSEPLIVVLDQFEEFFTSKRNLPYRDELVEQLIEAIYDHETAVIFVISMREDFAMAMDVFRNRLPTIFDNLYRLEKLSHEGARQAIVLPLERIGFQYEPALLKVLLYDLGLQEHQYFGFGVTHLPSEQQDANNDMTALLKNTDLMVESPHLQIVCKNLWEAERTHPNHLITLKMYEDKGRSRGILKTYFEEQIRLLSSAEKRLASLAFDHLVNRLGTKMTFPAKELSQLLRVNESALQKTLDKLEQARVLRKEAREGVIWYQLYHDVFSDAIYKWNERYKWRQRVQRATWSTMAVVFLGVVSIAGYDFWVNATQYHLRLSAKSGISDQIEVYQGQLGSWDFFGQQHYLYEIGYAREAVEADKLFSRTRVMDIATVDQEVIGRLPLSERIGAYLAHGELETALQLARCSVSDRDVTLAVQVVQNVGMFWSEQTVKLLGEWLQGKWLLQGEQNYEIREVMSRVLASTQSMFAEKWSLSALNSEFSEVRTAAISILGELGSEQAVLPLVDMLQNSDENEDVRCNAAEVLGSLGNQVAIQPLIASLKDSSIWKSDSCGGAIIALGNMGNQAVVQPLLALLKDSNENVRTVVVIALGGIRGQESVHSLITLLEDPNDNVRANSARALGELGNQEAIPTLVALLHKSNSRHVFSSIVDALIKLGNQEIIYPLITFLGNSDDYVQDKVAYALRKLGNQEVVQALITLLKDSNASVRGNAAYVLGGLGKQVTVQPLTALLKDDSDINVCHEAAQALAKLGNQEVVSLLIDLLKDSRPYMRGSVAEALGSLGNREAVKPLIALLKDSNANVRNSVAEALGNLGNQEAVKPLITLLGDSNSWVRNNAAEILLGKLESQTAVSLLITLFKDLDVRSIKELGKLGNQQAIHSLINLAIKEGYSEAMAALAQLGNSVGLPLLPPKSTPIKSPSDKFKEQTKRFSAEARRAVAEELAAIPLPESIQLLLPMLNDDNLHVKIQAIQSLGTIGHLQPEPVTTALLAIATDNLRIQRAVIEALATLAATFPAPQLSTRFLDTTRDTQVPFATRIAALKALKHFDNEPVAHQIIEIATQPAESSLVQDSLRFAAYQALENNHSLTALTFLNQQFQQLLQRKQRWRADRDAQETQEFQQTVIVDENCGKTPTDQQGRWQSEAEETQLAYTIARLNPQQGIQLLAHDLSNVRQGAWFGIATLNDVNLVKELIQQRQTNYTVPFRHAVFQAIDQSLITLEKKGSLQTRQTLQELLPSITDTAVKTRVEWTIAQMQYRFERTESH